MVNIREHGGFDEVAPIAHSSAAGHYGGALGPADVDVVEHGFHLSCRNHGTHGRPGGAGVADANGASARGNAVNHLIIGRPLDEYARSRRTNLACIEKDTRRGGTRSALQ